jgi:GPH family glycoside/pentoside/hexuronide:cation symporter
MKFRPNRDRTPPPADEFGKLTVFNKLAYGVGTTGISMTGNILAFFVMYFFTDVAGLPAYLAGSLLLIGKVTDAVSDVVIGWWSDRTRSPWGRRYPWIIFGAIPFCLSFALLWVIPEWNQWVLFTYYALMAMAYNIAYTAVYLPYVALTPELTQDYNERTSLNSFRFTFAIGSSLLVLVLAQGIFSLVPDPREQFFVLGLMTVAIALIAFYICVQGTWTRVMKIEAQRPVVEHHTALSLSRQIRTLVRNRPFLLVMGIYLCSWLSAQLTAVIMPYFVVSWMGLTSAAFTQFALAVQGTALLMLFVWSAVSRRVGKRTVYMMGISLWIVAQAGLFFIGPGQMALMIGLGVVAGFGVSTAYLVPWSMLPDVIDLDELRTGKRREGVFYACMIMLQKVGIALGLFLVGYALTWAGYIESGPGEPTPIQPDSALLVIRLVIGPLGTLILLAGLGLVYFYPITQDLHAQIRQRLVNRHQRDAQKSSSLSELSD